METADTNPTMAIVKDMKSRSLEESPTSDIPSSSSTLTAAGEKRSTNDEGRMTASKLEDNSTDQKHVHPNGFINRTNTPRDQAVPARQGFGNVNIEEPASHLSNGDRNTNEKYSHHHGGLTEKMNHLRLRATNRGHSGTNVQSTDPSKPPERNFGPGPKGFLRRVATVSWNSYVCSRSLLLTDDMIKGSFGASSVQ